MTDERRYSDEEFALILQRAAELQAPGQVPRRRGGLTLQEMMAIAEEAGLNPDAVARVARTLPDRTEGALARLFGGPASYRLEFELDRPLDEETRTLVLDAARGGMEHQGLTNVVGESLEWQTAAKPTQVSINVTPRGDGTRVQILVDRGGGVVLTLLVSALSGVAAGGILTGILEPGTVADSVIVAGGVAGTALAVSQTLWRTTTRSIKKKLSEVVAAVTRLGE